jgi:5-methyltetrahydrofolate--homocysteine methyltransferase
MAARIGETNWAKLEADWSAWWAGELDRPLLWFELSEPAPPGEPGGVGFIPSAMRSEGMTEEDVLERTDAVLRRHMWLGDAIPKFWPNYGAGVIAAFLGATVEARPETVWFEPPASCCDQPIDELTFGYDAENPWWLSVQSLTRRAAERWAEDLVVAHTDLGGNLDILSSFRTAEQLLFDCVDSPEQVERLAAEITQLWLRYYDELLLISDAGGRGTTPWAPIWSPTGRCYMLQSDFAYMISPEMFRRFVLPDLEACCATLDGGFYHLDGKGQLPHLDMLLAMDEMKGIQWIPGEGNPPPADKAWYHVQEKILQAGKLVQTFATREEALGLIRAVGGKGMMIAVRGCKTRQEIEDFMAAVEREVVRA